MVCLLDFSLGVRRHIRLAVHGSGRFTVVTTDTFLRDTLLSFQRGM